MKKWMTALTTLTASALLFGALPVSAADLTDDFENGLKYGLEESFTITEEGGNHSVLMDGGDSAWVSSGIDVNTYSYSNFTLTCDFKPLAFKHNSAALNIYFRGQEDSDETTGYRFLLGFQENGAGATYFNAQFEKDSPGGIREWPDPAVNIQSHVTLSTWQKLKIVAKGDKFELYLGRSEDSMTLVCSAQDSTYASGGFRFAVWGAKVQIDNLSITGSASNPPVTPQTTTTRNNSGKTTTRNNSGKTTTRANTPGTTTAPDGSGASGETTTAGTGDSTATGDESSPTETIRSTAAKTTAAGSDLQTGTDNTDGGLSTGAIVGIVIAVVVVAAGCAAAVVVIMKKRKAEESGRN